MVIIDEDGDSSDDGEVVSADDTHSIQPQKAGVTTRAPLVRRSKFSPNQVTRSFLRQSEQVQFSLNI